MSSQYKARVYVVDDEPTIAVTIAMILRKNGYEASWFVDPGEALAAAGQAEPHLVISDVAMPRMNGFELASRLGDAYPKCQVLLLSGHAVTSELLAAKGDHGPRYDVLPKPIHPDDLLSAIDRLQLSAWTRP